jgi:hypothetical protein
MIHVSKSRHFLPTIEKFIGFNHGTPVDGVTAVPAGHDWKKHILKH